MEAVAGALLGVAFEELTRATVAACERATSFGDELRQLRSTLETATPRINQIDQLTREYRFTIEDLEVIRKFKRLLELGKDLVETCSDIPRCRCWKRYMYAKKIRSLNESLGNLVKIELPGLQLDVILRVLIETNHMSQELLRNDVQHASAINTGPIVNRTEHRNHLQAIICCSCGIRYCPACLESQQ